MAGYVRGGEIAEYPATRTINKSLSLATRLHSLCITFFFHVFRTRNWHFATYV